MCILHIDLLWNCNIDGRGQQTKAKRGRVLPILSILFGFCFLSASTYNAFLSLSLFHSPFISGPTELSISASVSSISLFNVWGRGSIVFLNLSTYSSHSVLTNHPVTKIHLPTLANIFSTKLSHFTTRVHHPVCVFSKNGHSQPLYRLFLSFQTNITICTTNKCEKMSIQYMVLWFEHTTFRSWVSYPNH